MVKTVETALKALKTKFPDLRYGQAMWNALARAGMIRAPEGNSLFYIDDYHFMKVLYWSMDKCPAYKNEKHTFGVTVSIGGRPSYVCICGYVSKETPF